jgi:hypothetical protein
VAVKTGHQLKLFLNGKLAGASSSFDAGRFHLSNDKPLLIGFGARNYFAGFMKDLRIYDRALDRAEVKSLRRKD